MQNQLSFTMAVKHVHDTARLATVLPAQVIQQPHIQAQLLGQQHHTSIEGSARLWHDFILKIAWSLLVSGPILPLRLVKKVKPGHWPRRPVQERPPCPLRPAFPRERCEQSGGCAKYFFRAKSLCAFLVSGYMIDPGQQCLSVLSVY